MINNLQVRIHKVFQEKLAFELYVMMFVIEEYSHEHLFLLLMLLCANLPQYFNFPVRVRLAKVHSPKLTFLDNIQLQLTFKPHLHEQFFLDKFSLTRKTYSCRWGIVDNFSLSRKNWHASFSLTRKNYQVRNLPMWADNKENVARILLFSAQSLAR